MASARAERGAARASASCEGEDGSHVILYWAGTRAPLTDYNGCVYQCIILQEVIQESYFYFIPLQIGVNKSVNMSTDCSG